MFRAAHRSSSGALNCICSLWFIYTCGDRPLPRLSIINSITKLHLVGISTVSYIREVQFRFYQKNINSL